jgi:hypothetical protein
MLRVHRLIHKKQSIAFSRPPRRSTAAMAAEQPKRGSPLGNNVHVQGSSKKPRAAALPTAVVKQERLEEGGRRRDGETGQGNSDTAIVVAEVMDVPSPQLRNLTMGLTLFHCQACLLPLKPPTFKVSLQTICSQAAKES